MKQHQAGSACIIIMIALLLIGFVLLQTLRAASYMQQTSFAYQRYAQYKCAAQGVARIGIAFIKAGALTWPDTYTTSIKIDHLNVDGLVSYQGNISVQKTGQQIQLAAHLMHHDQTVYSIKATLQLVSYDADPLKVAIISWNEHGNQGN